MDTESALRLLIVFQIAQVGAFVHHLYACRKIQSDIGRIKERLRMQ